MTHVRAISSQVVRARQDAHDEARRQGMGGQALRGQLQWQGLPHLQPGDRGRCGDAERHLLEPPAYGPQFQTQNWTTTDAWKVLTNATSSITISFFDPIIFDSSEESTEQEVEQLLVHIKMMLPENTVRGKPPREDRTSITGASSSGVTPDTSAEVTPVTSPGVALVARELNATRASTQANPNTEETSTAPSPIARCERSPRSW